MSAWWIKLSILLAGVIIALIGWMMTREILRHDGMQIEMRANDTALNARCQAIEMRLAGIPGDLMSGSEVGRRFDELSRTQLKTLGEVQELQIKVVRIEESMKSKDQN